MVEMVQVSIFVLIFFACLSAVPAVLDAIEEAIVNFFRK